MIDWIPVTEQPHPPLHNGESDYVLVYCGKRTLPVVAMYANIIYEQPSGKTTTKGHWFKTNFDRLRPEPTHWAYINLPE